MRSDVLNDMARVLARSHQFARLEDRDRLIRAMAARHGRQLTVESSPDEMTHLVFIVRAGAADDCLNQLVELLHGRLDETAMLRLRQLNDEWDGIGQFTEDDWRTIRGALEQLRLSNAVELFRNTVQWRLPAPPPHCRSVWHIFVYLAGLNSDDQGVPLFMIFLRLVVDQLEGAVGQPLKVLLNRLAREWDITEAFQRAYWGRVRRPGGGSLNAALLILIEPHPLTPGHFTVTHWYQWDPERWRPRRGGDRVVPGGELETAVQGIVTAMEEIWPTGDGRLRIEFILPFELLNLPVERWRKVDPREGPVPLYRHHPVVVRSLDRIQDRRRHRAWRGRWRTLREAPTMADCLFSDGPADRLEERINRNERIVAMVLSEPPARPPGAREIRIAIRTGVPVIMWRRTGEADGIFRQTLADSLTYGGIVELPDRARELRITASMAEDGTADVGRNLVLLWDDPTRLPEELGSPASPGGH